MTSPHQWFVSFKFMNQIILVITERVVCVFCACGNEREMLTNYSNYGQVDYCFAVSTYCKVSKTWNYIFRCKGMFLSRSVCVCKCTVAGHCALIRLDSFGVRSGSDSTLSSQTVTHFHRVCVCVFTVLLQQVIHPFSILYSLFFQKPWLLNERIQLFLCVFWILDEFDIMLFWPPDSYEDSSYLCDYCSCSFMH